MAAKVDIAGTNISASQMSEFYRLAALPESHVNRATLQAYLEQRNPFAWERNRNGHLMVTVVGLDLSGEEEIMRLTRGGYRLGEHVPSCLTSAAADGYDAKHHLIVGCVYRLALVPGMEIPEDHERSSENLRALAATYGYGKALAGHVPRLRESVSTAQMKEMGIHYIASLHEPICSATDSPLTLRIGYGDNGPWVGTSLEHPKNPWGSPNGFFAFPESES